MNNYINNQLNYYGDNQLTNYRDNQLKYYEIALELKLFLKNKLGYEWKITHNKKTFIEKYFEQSENTPNRQCMIFFNIILGRNSYDKSALILNLESDYLIKIMVNGKNFMFTNVFFNYGKLQVVIDSLEKGTLKYGDKLCVSHLFNDCDFGEKCYHCNYVKNNYNIIGLLNMNCSDDKNCRDLKCNKYHQHTRFIDILCNPEKCIDKNKKECEEKKCIYRHKIEMTEEEKRKN